MHRRRPSKLFELFVILAVVLGVRALRAENLATIEGDIVTQSGTPISGATVLVMGTSLKKVASTDGSGHFAISGLPAGSYRVSATANGFATGVTSVTVAAGGSASVKLALAAKAAQKKPDTTAGKQRLKDVDKTEEMADEMTVMPSPPPPMSPSPMYKRTAKPSAHNSNGALMINGPSGQPIEQDPAMNTESYSRIDDNPFHRVATAPLSTFSVDVDTASYSNLRRFLKDGTLPPKDAVRIEEMINYFHYDYPAPPQGQPFSITTEVSQSPWNTKSQLVRIGLKAPEIEDAKVPARNLVFLLDVSGSMMDENKLPLLKRAMNLLVEEMRPQDRVAIAVYAGNSGLALPSTTGSNKDTIRSAILNLEAGGSTNGAAGIQLAYDVATQNFIKGGINRVILCTDGDFNVGTTSEGDLTRLIEEKREKGVFLTVLGFGMGNLKDSTMEKLADRGNGNYAYIDSIEEARKVLVKEAGATLVTVAKDVKLQVEFNPALVAGYRLVGYENRLLKDEDFNDDKKDAGDIGAGHSVTALYEIVPAGQEVPGAKVDALKYQTPHATTPAAGSSELMTVKIRYKAPDGKTSKLLSQPVKNETVELAKASTDFRWATAVAELGMLLRDSQFRGNVTFAQISSLAEGAVGQDVEGYRKEFLKMLAQAQKLKH
jgi:Ca-activated chloride channel family protein